MGLGRYVLNTADAALRKAGVLPDPVGPETDWTEWPVVRAFTIRYPSASAQSIQRFYDEYDKNKQYFDTYQAKAKEGDIAAMQHIQQMGGLRMFVQLDQIKRALTEHGQIISNITRNPTMTASDKRQKIDQLYFRSIEVAGHGLAVMRKVDAALVGR